MDLQLQPGDLLLTRSTGAVGSLIRFGERVRAHGWRTALARAFHWMLGFGIPEQPDDPAWCNHVAVYVGDGWLVEALAAGITCSPLDKYAPGSYRVARAAKARPDITDAERAAGVAHALRDAKRHAEYGWPSIASIILQILTPIKLDISWDGAKICSAEGAETWEHMGIEITTLSALTTMPSYFWPYTDPIPVIPLRSAA